MKYDLGDSLPIVLETTEFHLIENLKESCHEERSEAEQPSLLHWKNKMSLWDSLRTRICAIMPQIKTLSELILVFESYICLGNTPFPTTFMYANDGMIKWNCSFYF